MKLTALVTAAALAVVSALPAYANPEAAASKQAILDAIYVVERSTTKEMLGVTDPDRVTELVIFLEQFLGPAPFVIDGFTFAADGSFMTIYSNGEIVAMFVLEGADPAIIAELMRIAYEDGSTDDVEAYDANLDGKGN